MRLSDRLFLDAQEGVFAKLPFLRPASGLFAIGANLKNALYSRGWLPISRLPIPVVSIGSLVAGGSGKTPLVHLLAKSLKPFGRIAILSRGYRAKESGLALGDELQMLKNRLGDGLYYAGAHRASLGKKAAEEGAKIALLDDGFQHRRLHRDLELVVLDPANPFGYGAFLPRGLLRDSPKELKRADAIFLSGDSELDLSMYTEAPVIRIKPKIRRILDAESHRTVSIQEVPVGAFCAIARPKKFFETLRQIGADCLERWPLADHAKPDTALLEAFAKRCKRRGAKAIVCTEKDAVKLQGKKLALPLYYLEMELEIVSNLLAWQSLIEKIALKMNNQAI